MEHGKLNHLLFPWHTVIQMNTYFPKSILVFETLIIQTETFSPQYKYPFGEFASLIYFEVQRRKMMTCVGIFTKRPIAGMQSPTFSYPKNARKNYADKSGWNEGMKKRDEAKQVRRIWTAPPVQVNTEPPRHLTIVRSEKKIKISELLALETEKKGSVVDTKQESKC